jgi:pilus assembly protein CpaF
MSLRERLSGTDEERHYQALPEVAQQAYQELKKTMHQMILDRIDLERLKRLTSEQFKHELALLVQRIIEEERIVLNQQERHHLVLDIQHEMLGFGPLEPLLNDPTVSDILVNTHSQVYVERRGRLELTDVSFHDNAHLMKIIEKIVSRVGRRVDESSPMVDARLPDGSRVNAIIPPLAVDGPLVSIRRFGAVPLSVQNLIDYKSITPPMIKVLESLGLAKVNILISGGTGSGKTTLLNLISGFIPGNERIVTIEDAAELQLRQPHVVRLETRPPNIEGKGEVTQRALVRNSLRMRPDRIILGEVRGAEALDMLQAMNTGHEGSLATIHANTPRDALSRLENMVSMAGVNDGTRDPPADLLGHHRDPAGLAPDRRHPQGGQHPGSHGHGRRHHLDAGDLPLRADRRRRGRQGAGPFLRHRRAAALRRAPQDVRRRGAGRYLRSRPYLHLDASRIGAFAWTSFSTVSSSSCSPP